MLDNFLPKAVFISITLHTIMVCGGYLWHMPVAAQKQKVKGVEISVKPPSYKKTDLKDRAVKPAQQLDLKNTSSIARNNVTGVRLNRPGALPKSFMMVDRKRQLIAAAPMAHRIVVAPIKSEKINNPAYAAFSEMVRSRIQTKVYENYQHTPEDGGVYLTFVISSDGTLKAAQIIDDRSHASLHLKDVSLKSIKDCVFPPFLQGMTLPEYTFNIEIQFQGRD